jgi:hypothetical protein
MQGSRIGNVEPIASRPIASPSNACRPDPRRAKAKWRNRAQLCNRPSAVVMAIRAELQACMALVLLKLMSSFSVAISPIIRTLLARRDAGFDDRSRFTLIADIVVNSVHSLQCAPYVQYTFMENS